jgi:hypothetical protein
MANTKAEAGGTAAQVAQDSALENRFAETDGQIQTDARRARKIIQTGTTADLVKFANEFALEEARAHRARLHGE